MNKKLLYTLPALAAVVALMFVVATPYVLAESGDNAWKMGKFHKHHTIQVDGFVGSIQITEDTDRATLKDKVTVSLSEASQGLDVHMAKLGKVTNENGDKFLAWTLVSVDKNEDTVTFTIHVVDAGDADNTAQITKEFDHSFKTEHDSDEKA
ncbi:MAG TPA: hypothetical protein VGA92_04440 [Candidatus Nitrosotenuis sp.]|jgi:hypothetical protein